MVDARHERRKRLETPCRAWRGTQGFERVDDGVVNGADIPERAVPFAVGLEVVVESLGDGRPVLLANRQAHETRLLRQADRHGAGTWHARDDIRSAKARA